MKIFIKYITITLTLFNFVYASGETKKAETFVPKKGGAVTAFNKEDGFKLSQKAVKNLGVKFKSIKGNSTWIIPKSSLVRVKHSTGVYRKWDGWITLVLVNIVSSHKEGYKIKSLDLEDGDEIATAGVSFLRMTEADLHSDTVDACAH